MESVAMHDPPLTDNDDLALNNVTNGDMAGRNSSRVELYRQSASGQVEMRLNMKITDLKLEHLARVFKVDPETLYLQEELSNNAEFAVDGVFSLHFGPYSIRRYQVCGEDQLTRNGGQQGPTFSMADVTASQGASQLPRYTAIRSSRFTPTGRADAGTWQAEFSSLSAQRLLADTLNEQSAGGSSLGTPLSKRVNRKTAGDVYWKRTIPYVSLGIEGGNGRNLCVDTIIRNLFLKIPESTVSAATILAEAGSRISNLQDELLLLDSKYIPIAADDNTDADFWKTPNRRLYLVGAEQFERMMRIVKRNKKPLKLRRTAAVIPESGIVYGEQLLGIAQQEEEDADENHQIKDCLLKISKDIIEMKQVTKMNLSSMAMPFFECKICRDVPVEPLFVTCCQQVLGCKNCIENWIDTRHSCPLCRGDAPQMYKINGYDQLLDYLRCIKSSSDVGTEGLEDQ